MAWRGLAGPGVAGQAWLGEAWQGMAWLGVARRGMAGQGKAGKNIYQKKEWEEKMVYQWRDERHTKGLDADVFGQEMERLESEHGQITANMLLDSARSSESRIHNYFEWNDSIAAEKFRLRQASYFICALAIAEQPSENLKVNTPIRAYMNVGTRSNGEFVNTKAAISDESMREIVLKNALEELKRAQSKYRGLSELSEVFVAIDHATLAIKGSYR